MRTYIQMKRKKFQSKMIKMTKDPTTLKNALGEALGYDPALAEHFILDACLVPPPKELLARCMMNAALFYGINSNQESMQILKHLMQLWMSSAAKLRAKRLTNSNRPRRAQPV